MNDYIPVTRIKVFGVGGGGSNAVSRMAEANLSGVTFYVANTDRQALVGSPCENKILLGANTTHGLGAGGNPEVGKAAAEESIDEIRELVKDTDMVFITAGMGGGTGTGAAPIFARCAKEAGALTIGIVTKPFSFEGPRRMLQALTGLDEFKKNVDSIIVVPNEKVCQLLGDYPMKQAFIEADNVLRQAVQTITDLMGYNALINLDFKDVESVMSGQNTALIGVGQVSKDEAENAEQMAIIAAERAVSCPLLEANIEGATNALINISGGDNLTLSIANKAVETVKKLAGNELDVKFGTALIESLNDSIVVTVIATGFEEENKPVETYEAPSFAGAQPQDNSKNSIEVPKFFGNR